MRLPNHPTENWRQSQSSLWGEKTDKQFSSRLFLPSISHSFSINRDYVSYTEGKQNRMMGWPKQPLGEGKSITHRNKALFYFFPFLPKMLPSIHLQPGPTPRAVHLASPLMQGASVPQAPVSPPPPPELTRAPFSSSTLAQATWPPRQASWRADTRSVVTRFTSKPCKAGKGAWGESPAQTMQGAGVGASVVGPWWGRATAGCMSREGARVGLMLFPASVLSPKDGSWWWG